MRKRFVFIVCALFLVGGAFAWAQSNEVLDNLLEQDKALYADTLYLVFTAAGLLDESADPADSLPVPVQKGWAKSEAAADKPIRLGELSHFIMKALNLPAGILNHISPGPRYAARDLAFYGIIDQHFSPYRFMSGEEAIRIIRNAVEWKEANL